MRRHNRIVTAVAAASQQQQRLMSETRVPSDTSDRPWQRYWQGEGAPPTYPRRSCGHPRLRMSKTKNEWLYHYGHGARLGMYGPTREIADFEHEDGTPAPAGLRRFAYMHHQDGFLVQLIRACAAVEWRLQQDRMPRIPGTPEQRDWDPEIPLFLEDVDEHGKAPVEHYENRSSATVAAAGASAAPATTISAAMKKRIDEKFGAADFNRVSKHLVNEHEGETLQPNTMFASYDPSSFISEPVPRRTDENKRPHWSRRRWALTNQFLVPMNPKPKNTIQDA